MVLGELGKDKRREVTFDEHEGQPIVIGSCGRIAGRCAVKLWTPLELALKRGGELERNGVVKPEQL